MPRSDKVRASWLNGEGARQLCSDPAAAERALREAVELDPTLDQAWFNLGLLCKWAKRWEEAFDCNLRSAELVGEKPDEPSWWNLAIAATALHRWDVARRAWTAYGIDVPPGDGPIEGDYGITPVRINADGRGEVLWGRRIDPARARIENIPLPDSGHRWGDIVLHDGEPNGHRIVRGKEWGVFDVLERWAPSDVPTVQASVHVDTVFDVDDLIRRLQDAGHAAEDWTRNTRMLCKSCSEGRVDGHDHAPPQPVGPHERSLGIAGPLEDVTLVVRIWESPPDRRCESLTLVM